MNDWIDLPIISALDYFQGILTYFMGLSRKYGLFIGMIGLVWTAIKLINSRIDMRSAWWDTFSKWFIFILLINFYWTGTNLLSRICNEVGINAGNGKNTIISNFTSLKSRIEAETKLHENYVNGITSFVNSELMIDLDYIQPGQDVADYMAQLSDQMNENDTYKFSSKAEKKKIDNKIKEFLINAPKDENTIWGAQTLEVLNSILITTGPDGSKKNDLTGAYVTDKPELNIWLKDSSGKETCYLSSSAIVRVGVLTAQIIWEKSQMEVIENKSEDGTVEYKIKKKKIMSLTEGISWDFLGTSIMAGICAICIIVSVLFATIQYTMCILEYIIVQGIGAAFIPFYLFDGTKDIPKKLLPVFTGFAIKILVMIICLMFIINLNLVFAAQQISPSSGNMGWPAFAECLFIGLLSFLLTSNAPKIAMTLLTGQPQLSMGEFVQAAGAMVAGGMAAKNVAKTAASPAVERAKEKAHEWSEQRGAASDAKDKQENSMRTEFAKKNGIDTTTRKGQKQLDQQWNSYRNDKANKKGIDEKINTAGRNAAEETKQLQNGEYLKNGGSLGSAGRLLAHYTGAVLSPKETMMQGRKYNMPYSNLDISRIADNNKVSFQTDNMKFPENTDKKNENMQEPSHGDKPEDPNIGERENE